MKTPSEIPSNSNRSMIKSREQGVALVMGLVILLVLTILGITALRTSSLQQLMAGNVQEATRAFVVAESGLDWLFVGDIASGNTMANFKLISGTSAPVSITLPAFNVTGSNDVLRASVTVYRTIQVQTTNNFSNMSNKSSGTSTSFAYLDQVAIGTTGNIATPISQDVKQQEVRQKIPAQSGDTFTSSGSN